MELNINEIALQIRQSQIEADENRKIDSVKSALTKYNNNIIFLNNQEKAFIKKIPSLLKSHVKFQNITLAKIQNNYLKNSNYTNIKNNFTTSYINYIKNNITFDSSKILYLYNYISLIPNFFKTFSIPYDSFFNYENISQSNINKSYMVEITNQEILNHRAMHRVIIGSEHQKKWNLYKESIENENKRIELIKNKDNNNLLELERIKGKWSTAVQRFKQKIKEDKNRYNFNVQIERFYHNPRNRIVSQKYIEDYEKAGIKIKTHSRNLDNYKFKNYFSYYKYLNPNINFIKNDSEKNEIIFNSANKKILNLDGIKDEKSFFNIIYKIRQEKYKFILQTDIEKAGYSMGQIELRNFILKYQDTRQSDLTKISENFKNVYFQIGENRNAIIINSKNIQKNFDMIQTNSADISDMKARVSRLESIEKAGNSINPFSVITDIVTTVIPGSKAIINNIISVKNKIEKVKNIAEKIINNDFNISDIIAISKEINLDKELLNLFDNSDISKIIKETNNVKDFLKMNYILKGSLTSEFKDFSYLDKVVNIVQNQVKGSESMSLLSDMLDKVNISEDKIKASIKSIDIIKDTGRALFSESKEPVNVTAYNKPKPPTKKLVTRGVSISTSTMFSLFVVVAVAGYFYMKR